MIEGNERLVAMVKAKNTTEAIAALEMLLQNVKNLGPEHDGEVDDFVVEVDPEIES